MKKGTKYNLSRIQIIFAFIGAFFTCASYAFYFYFSKKIGIIFFILILLTLLLAKLVDKFIK